MPVDLGDVYPLTINIFDADGQLANAGELTLTVTLPDGSINNVGVLSPVTTGIYQYDYATTQVGRHVVRWLATGPNASADGSTFYVDPTDTGEFISLTHVKQHMSISGNDRDDLLRTYLAGACAVINERVGQIAPTTFVEDKCSQQGYVKLDHWPVIEVTSVQYLPGLMILPAGNAATGSPGWTLSDAYQPLQVGTGNFRVTYRAGRIDIPQNYILAALELTQHLWQVSQQNSGGGRQPVPNDEVIIQGTTYALPFNIRQLLGLDKRTRMDIFVG